jgi:hypothetical protein
MPIQSRAQQRWAYANEKADTREGAAAREFIAATPKSAYKKLPARVKPKPKPTKSFGRMGGY